MEALKNALYACTIGLWDRLNPQQKTAAWLALIASGGPLAKILVKHLGIPSDTVKDILDLAAYLTPLIAGGGFIATQSDAAKVRGVGSLPFERQLEVAAGLPVETKVADAASLPAHDAAQVAAALPDSANLAAVYAMPEVEKVVVSDNATDGVRTAMQDSNLEKVVPSSQQEDGKS